MAGADTTLKIEADTSSAVRSIATLNSAFDGLKSKLLGLSIGAAVAQANQFALSLDQASRASGVALGTVQSFSTAVSNLGGDANRAAGDIIDFVAGLDSAKQGSASAQVALARIGISLSDLGKMSNEDLFKQTVQGIAKIGDASTRNALAVQMLGKSFKDIDVRDVAKTMAAGGGGGADVGAIKSAAEAQRNLAKNIGTLQAALIEVIKPLNDIVKSVNVSKETFKELIIIVGTVAAAFGVFKYIITPLTAVATSAEGAAVAVSTLGFKISSVFAPITRVITGFLGDIELIGLAFTGLFSKVQTVLTPLGRLMSFFSGLIGLFARFLGVVGWVYTGLEILDFALRKLFNIDFLSPAVKWMEDSLSSLIRKAGEFLGIIDKPKTVSTEQAKKDFRQQENADAEKIRTEELKKQKEERDKIVNAFRAQRLEQDKLVAGYKLEINNSIRQLDFQNTLIGKTQEEQDKKSKLFELETAYIGKVNEILAKQAELKAASEVGTKEEVATYNAYSANVQKTVMALARQYEVQLEAGTKLIDRGQGLALLEKDRENTIARITSLMEQQTKIAESLTAARLKIGEGKQDQAFAARLIGKSPLQKQMAQIREDQRKAELEAGRAFAAAFEDTGDGLTPERMKQLSVGLKAIADGYKEIADRQVDNLSATREWSAGWTEAFATYVNEADDAANQAKTYFETFTKGWEDAIVNFVKTGKLSFKDLANSMIAEFARIQAKKMFVQLFGDNTAGGGGGLLGSLFGGFFGKAGGGDVMSGKPYMVGESGRELFVPNSAGRIIPGDQLGGGGSTNVTYNINAVDSQSFRTMIARDPQFIYNITEAGRRSQPSRRLA